MRLEEATIGVRQTGGLRRPAEGAAAKHMSVTIPVIQAEPSDGAPL